MYTTDAWDINSHTKQVKDSVNNNVPIGWPIDFMIEKQVTQSFVRHTR